MFTKEYWKSSAVKLRQTKYLAIMATMIALKAVLANFSIPLSETLRINFGYMVTSVEAAVVGPVAGCAWWRKDTLPRTIRSCLELMKQIT